MDDKRPETEEDLVDSPPPVDPTVRVWHVFGKRVPRSEIVFFSQVIIIYIVIITCIINLTTYNGRQEVWIALLSSSLGYLLPQPQLEDGGNVRLPPEQQLNGRLPR